LTSDINRNQDSQNLEADQVAAATLLNTDLFENATVNPFAHLPDEDDKIHSHRCPPSLLIAISECLYFGN